ncbi:MAG: anaerobic ribonucleoside-triphosphate reductase activating protein [Oscillospiraceae bacterium]|nr:anaerobic ribonucleoside-triphosphate reductase activating protein [Oscillospiraceae bacterium]
MICGLQKMTLLDFPGKIACTVFLGGCNFRCPFCHNSELFMGSPQKLMEDEEFFAFLKTRKGLLDGVCVSGGEPTLYKNLPEFLAKIKELGFLVKLDTNGSRPALVKELVEKNLVDYIAMDVKNSPAMYAQTVGLESMDLAPIEESMRFLIGGTVPYELRTTLVSQLHTEESIQDMGAWLGGLVTGMKPKQLFLQSFVDRDTVLFAGLSAPETDTTAKFAKILEPFCQRVTIRNP